MNKKQQRHTMPPIVLACLLLLFPLLSQAELVVIGNSAMAVDSVTPKQLKKLWLGKKHKLSGTGRITVVDQKEGSDAFTTFYAKVVRKKPNQLKAYWAKISFTGKGFPPEQLANDAAVVEWVAAGNDRLGYVDSAAVSGSVKILLTVK